MVLSNAATFQISESKEAKTWPSFESNSAEPILDSITGEMILDINNLITEETVSRMNKTNIYQWLSTYHIIVFWPVLGIELSSLNNINWSVVSKKK